MVRVRGLSRLFWYGALAFSLTACASMPRDPVTPELEDQVSVIEKVQVRYWGGPRPRQHVGFGRGKMGAGQVEQTRSGEGGRTAADQFSRDFGRRL